MPHYYFHFRDTLFKGDVGEVLADAGVAHAYAKRIALELAQGSESRHAMIIVTEGQSDHPLFEVPMPPMRELN